MTESNFFIDTYTQDSVFAKEYSENPKLVFTPIEFDADREFRDGPTSSRFAIVDFNGNSQELAPPAIWDDDNKVFRKSKAKKSAIIDRSQLNTLQFHQVNTWAILEEALAFFEEPKGLGRSIPWGFDGNKLIVVPHAGYGKNAYYDRTSKSLQFYFFKGKGENEKPGEMIYTCLSSDIIRHEFGHAILDGIRPHFLESTSVQAAAFHEFLGDLLAILLLLKNKVYRSHIAVETEGDITRASYLSSIAKQFGIEVKNKPFLRNAQNNLKITDLNKPQYILKSQSGHFVSQILTGAVFDILIKLTKAYPKRERASGKVATPKQAFWNTIDRMQRTAIQPLDLLPPVDITFADYAQAMLRHEELSNPKDPYDYKSIMLSVFGKRGILSEKEVKEFSKEDYLLNRNEIDFKDLPKTTRLVASKTDVYKFLDRNREALLIPENVEIIVKDPYHADKYMRQGYRMPRQYFIQYIWHEELEIDGQELLSLKGEKLTMKCGGTLVLDYEGRILSWMVKPGTHLIIPEGRITNRVKKLKKANAEGIQRKKEFLKYTKAIIASGQLDISSDEDDVILTRLAPLKLKKENGAISFNINPCLHLDEDSEQTGTRQWEKSF